MSSRAIAFLAAALVMSPPTAASAMTTRQMVALRPPAADRTAKRDLLSVLEPVKEIRTGMLVRLRGIAMRTAPYGTRVNGLCRMDELDLRYAPTDPSPEQKDQPLQAFGFDSDHLFHVLSGSKKGLDSKGDTGWDATWREDCDRLGSQEDINWFSAKNELEAAEGVNLLAAATAAIKAGRLAPSLCDVFESKKTCAEVILDEGKVEHLDGVQNCHSVEGKACYLLTVNGSTELTIVASDMDAAAPEILSVSIRQYVVVT